MREILVTARERKGLSQAAAAVAIGVSTDTVSRWERGESIPRGYNRQKLCEVYEIKAEDLEDARIMAVARPSEEATNIIADISKDLTMCLLALAHRTMPTQELQDTMTENLQGFDDITRREALRRLVMFSALMGIADVERPIPDILAQCSAGVAACRELGKGKDSSDISLAFRGVSSYLTVLTTIVRDSMQYRQLAASTAAQCCRVKATLAWHVENLQQASLYSKDAVEYARATKDPALLVSTLISQAWVCYYSKRPDEGIKALGEDAIPLLGRLPKSVAVRVWSTLAVLEAKAGQDSTDSLRQAHKTFSKTSDDYFAFADGMTPELIGNEAMTYYHAGDQSKAMDTFSQLIDPEDLTLKIPLSGKARVEMLNLMTLSTLKQPKKNLDQVLTLWEAGLSGAKALQSNQRFNESSGIYDAIEAVWPNEPHVKERRKQLVHWAK